MTMIPPEDCRVTKFEIVTDTTGVCARLTGTAFTYHRDVRESVLLPGCVSRIRPQTRLLVNHDTGAAPIGLVRSIEDSGDTAVVTADVHDTKAGRYRRDTIRDALEAGLVVGLDIGYVARASHTDTTDGKTIRYVTEIDLIEVSVLMPPQGSS